MKGSSEIPSKTGRQKKAYDGRPIAILRIIRARTQQQLADATGIKVKKIGKFERSESVPDEHELVEIADALRVPFFVLDDLREMVAWVDRFGAESSLPSGRIGANGPEPEVVREPDPFDPERVRRQARRLNDARVVSRTQKALSELFWRVLQGPDDP
jgi:transcriptional regulator with XRE-family HTH domain